MSKNLEIMDIFRKQKFACFTYLPSIVTSWSFENSPVQPTVFLESSPNNPALVWINQIQDRFDTVMLSHGVL